MKMPAIRKATVSSPSNIAFIKYWGARDLDQIVPENPSLSMTLSACTSRTTVQHVAAEGEHEIRWRGAGGGLETAPPAFAERVQAHLDRLRDWADCGGHFRMATENTFPAAAGIASSASGFSALTLAVLAALGRDEPPAERSRLARLSGSGSASRSVLGGYVRWPASTAEQGEDGNVAEQVAPASHWDLRDVIALVATQAKGVSSLDGHRRARSSPHFERRLEILPERFQRLHDALLRRDFDTFGQLVETEAIELHMIAMTSEPPIFYWQPATLEILAEVRSLRESGCAAWATMDAGANVHVITEAANEEQVAGALSGLPGVERLIRDRVGDGPRKLDEHLF